MDAGFLAIARQASFLANKLPPATIRAVAQAIESCDTANWPYAQHQILQTVTQDERRVIVGELLTVWRRDAPSVSPEAVCLALLSAAATHDDDRDGQKTELIWTGPNSLDISLRRTDQALLQVIGTSKTSLLIVSFAVYSIPTISNAIVRAAGRGVNIRICIETPDASGGSVGYDMVGALGDDIRDCVTIYTWPRSQRPRDDSGRAGSLHAKCAVADERLLFVSSANLTGYAMNLNMELGVLIEGGRLPGMVSRQFLRLIDDGILALV